MDTDLQAIHQVIADVETGLNTNDPELMTSTSPPTRSPSG